MADERAPATAGWLTEDLLDLLPDESFRQMATVLQPAFAALEQLDFGDREPVGVTSPVPR